MGNRLCVLEIRELLDKVVKERVLGRRVGDSLKPDTFGNTNPFIIENDLALREIPSQSQLISHAKQVKFSRIPRESPSPSS